MAVILSTTSELESGAGFYGLSSAVACDTNEKIVILVQDSGYRDTVIEVFFSGGLVLADPVAGSISTFQIKLNEQVVWQTRINSLQAEPQQYACQLFIPRNTQIQITQTDADTTGTATTMLRGYYLEPPVMQQD